ncbi:DUF59 domain-containing protein [Kaarinaea lacus]
MNTQLVRLQSTKSQGLEIDSKIDALPLREQVIEQLRTVFDPELPLNIYDLGLIYAIDINENSEDLNEVNIAMTLTSPNCPVAGSLPMQAQHAVQALPKVGKVTVNLVWDPPWDHERLSDEAKLVLDMF